MIFSDLLRIQKFKINISPLRSDNLSGRLSQLGIAIFYVFKQFRIVMQQDRAVLLIVSFAQPKPLERTQVAQPRNRRYQDMIRTGRSIDLVPLDLGMRRVNSSCYFYLSIIIRVN